MNKAFTSLRLLVPKKYEKISLNSKMELFLLIWAVPLLIWWGVGKHVVIMLSQFN